MSENNSVGEHPLERELDAGKEAESLLIKALRQYQHNDCSGLLVAYDYLMLRSSDMNLLNCCHENRDT